eukprot:CAMPEP_0181246726 /NCGR_PEP_ID=MMETSP1096-20121128/44170_1 /TAXON_ID=156174 ORGANISM="Chrysochromulina ericina, Strain CCMP281" /NCGR_SAMPLE_ID=MMETSP1096 /ASSEMBLY_ACC=CAM_ASM_000453 /LENGTH=79 /DNA_ID=CAMNT_0023343607 /DNA_START=185 /DNA_END=420 /DNA_ORIENTATION=+
MGHCISASYARFAPRQSRGLEAAAATFRGSEPSMKSNVRAARDACRPAREILSGVNPFTSAPHKLALARRSIRIPSEQS